MPRIGISLDAIHAPVMALDRQGRIIEFNEACERLLGYLRGEVCGRHPCDSLIVPEDQEAARAFFQAPSTTTVRRSLESTWVKRDGSRRRIAWSLATTDGEHLVATGLDVTEPPQTRQLPLKPQEDLGERVRERTAELAAANARLQEEIAQRIRVEEELRQSEAQVRKQLAVLDAIFRAAPIGLSVVDHTLCYARVNEQLAAFNDLAASAHAGKSISEVIPHLAGQVEGLYRRALETGEPIFNIEVHGRRGSDPQTEHVWQVSHSPVKLEDGTIVGVCAAVQDITERKRAEEALRLSEARLLEAQRIGRLGFWEWQFVSDRVDVFWSDETYAIFGYRPGEIVPSTELFYEAIHPDDRAFVRQQNESLRRGVESPQIDYRIVDAAGQVRHVRSRRKVYLTENGEPWRAMGTAQDITDLRRVEESLRIKEAAIASAISGIGITDLEGNLIYVNKAFLEIGGYAEEGEVLGRPIVSFAQHPQEADAVLSLLWRGKSWQGEMVACRKDGTLADALVSANPVVSPSGKITCLMVSSIDITARKRAEQSLRDSERFRAEAERLAAAGRMAARIAHEINNPLAGIMGCFELVKRSVPADHADHEYAEMIEREIKRIGDIVRQMYELHRPSDHEVRTVHLAETVREVVTMLRASLRQHEVGIEDQTAKAGIAARLPEGSLRQVLYNLLANAVEASPPGGVVTISAAQTGTQFQILIADQGPGIPAETRDRIFQPFFTTKDRGNGGGLGLGLSISKGIVDSLQGTIDFENQPGRGTIFRVILPQNASNQESASSP